MEDTTKIYFVYEHLDREGRCFYIGKGQKMRHYSTKGRNQDWWDVALDGDTLQFTALKIYENLTEEDAYDKEDILLREYGIDSLTNRIHGKKRKESKTN